jgi:uncharacterized membrane protein
MIHVEQQTAVEAPVGDVFDYMDRPRNQPEITPSLTRSEAVEVLPNGGKRVAYTYTFGGVDFDGHVEAVEYEPESQITWEMTGDLEGGLEWNFEASNGRTTVTYGARYGLPVSVPVLDVVLEPLAEWYNEREIRITLENLRSRLERGSTP